MFFLVCWMYVSYSACMVSLVIFFYCRFYIIRFYLGSARQEVSKFGCKKVNAFSCFDYGFRCSSKFSILTSFWAYLEYFIRTSGDKVSVIWFQVMILWVFLAVSFVNLSMLSLMQFHLLISRKLWREEAWSTFRSAHCSHGNLICMDVRWN